MLPGAGLPAVLKAYEGGVTRGLMPGGQRPALEFSGLHSASKLHHRVILMRSRLGGRRKIDHATAIRTNSTGLTIPYAQGCITHAPFLSPEVGESGARRYEVQSP
jgi:hypothetical protein